MRKIICIYLMIMLLIFNAHHNYAQESKSVDVQSNTINELHIPSDQTEAKLKEQLRLNKYDNDARNRLVAVYIKNKKYDDLISLLKEGVELTPNDANSHYKLGLIYEYKKEFEKAIMEYKEAVKIKSDHANALNALGRVYLKTRQKTEAKEALEAALKADPGKEETKILLNNIYGEQSLEQKMTKNDNAAGKPVKSNIFRTPNNNKMPNKIEVADNVIIVSKGNSKVMGKMKFAVGGEGVLGSPQPAGPVIVAIWRDISKSEASLAAKKGIKVGIAYLQTESGDFKQIRKVNLKKSNDELFAEFGLK